MSMSALSWHDDRSPRELAHWAIAAAVVLGAHAGALIYLLAAHEPDIVGSNMDVVTVELAPIDSTPDAVERDLAPAPETMVESSPLPDLPKPQEKPFGRDGRCHRANLSIKRNEPHSGAGLLGLIPTRTKHALVRSRILSYRIMVDARLTPAGSITAPRSSAPRRACKKDALRLAVAVKYEPAPAAAVAHPPVGSARDHSRSLTLASACSPRHA